MWGGKLEAAISSLFMLLVISLLNQERYKPNRKKAMSSGSASSRPPEPSMPPPTRLLKGDKGKKGTGKGGKGKVKGKFVKRHHDGGSYDDPIFGFNFSMLFELLIIAVFVGRP